MDKGMKISDWLKRWFQNSIGRACGFYLIFGLTLHLAGIAFDLSTKDYWSWAEPWFRFNVADVVPIVIFLWTFLMSILIFGLQQLKVTTYGVSARDLINMYMPPYSNVVISTVILLELCLFVCAVLRGGKVLLLVSAVVQIMNVAVVLLVVLSVNSGKVIVDAIEKQADSGRSLVEVQRAGEKVLNDLMAESGSQCEWDERERAFKAIMKSSGDYEGIEEIGRKLDKYFSSENKRLNEGMTMLQSFFLDSNVRPKDKMSVLSWQIGKASEGNEWMERLETCIDSLDAADENTDNMKQELYAWSALWAYVLSLRNPGSSDDYFYRSYSRMLSGHCTASQIRTIFDTCSALLPKEVLAQVGSWLSEMNRTDKEGIE